MFKINKSAQHTPRLRLSEKQREFLADIATSETPTEDHPQGLPFYLRHTHMEFRFNTASERERWYRNLETRGLIVRTGYSHCFVRLTDAGRAAIAKATGNAV